MDRFPVMQSGRDVGELTVCGDGLYSACSVVCCPAEPGVCRAFLVGEQGELRLGVPAPSGGAFCVCRRVAVRELETLGRLRYAELRSCQPPSGGWQVVERPEELFHDPFLRRILRGAENVRAYRESGGVRLALPFDPGKPFPLPALFCFARVQCVCGARCVVYAFDSRENPVIW